MIYLGLFLSFFQIGLFSFGGGLATIPFIQALSESTGWFGIEDVMNMIAISEATPGPLGINMATYVGYLTSSYGGAIIAALGLVLPSIVVIICVAKLLEQIRENSIVKRVFYGLRASSVGLIFLAFFETFKITSLKLENYNGILSLFDVIQIVPLLLSMFIFFLIRKFRLHPTCYLLFAAIVGILLKL